MTELFIIAVVLVTGTIAFLFSERIKANHRLFSTFSAALVAALIFVHILPDVYNSESSAKWIGFALLLGLVLQLILEKVTHGVGHGHEHSHAKNHKSILIGAMLGLCAHAFIEGMPISIDEHQDVEVVETEDHDHDHLHDHSHEAEEVAGEHDGHEHIDYSQEDDQLSSKFISAVLMHKVPVTIMLSLFLLSVGVKGWRFFLLLALFAVMTPAGVYVGQMLMSLPEVSAYKYYLLALSTGMLLHIITSILFEHGHSRKETNLHILLIISGIGIGILLF